MPNWAPLRPAEVMAGLGGDGTRHRCPHSNALRSDARSRAGRGVNAKQRDRLLRRLLAANAPPAPIELRQALGTVDRHVQDYAQQARIAA